MTWQPIETAPEGQHVIVFHWIFEEGDVTLAERTGNVWWDAHDTTVNPTHWMPLPDPAKEAM